MCRSRRCVGAGGVQEMEVCRSRMCAGAGGVQESVCRCLVTAQETRRRLTEPPRQHTVTTIPAQDADFN